jgi:hypothetical protein
MGIVRSFDHAAAHALGQVAASLRKSDRKTTACLFLGTLKASAR